MSYILERAAKHRGVSFVEIYQNCLIFNDKTFTPITGRETREDRMVYLEDGKPLVFGKKKEKAIRLKGLQPEVVELANTDPKDLLIHNEKDPSPHYAYLLTQMDFPQMPVPFGVLRAIERPTFDEMMESQIQEVVKTKGKGNLKDLIYGRDTWTVQ
jgi:2-oxoglutarate ferredoxin oxidoreductase subunit beta